MGIATVAVHSQADKESLHVSLADESVCCGQGVAGRKLLLPKDIITAALLTGAQPFIPDMDFWRKMLILPACVKKTGWYSSAPAQSDFPNGR